MVLRCTLKLRDGRVHAGYTPAFDPADGSVWLTATPDSPAGTMFTMDRVRALVLEPMEGRSVVLPSTGDHTPAKVRVDFSDGESLHGERRVVLEGVGLWVEPAGRPKARAFVPLAAAMYIELDGGVVDPTPWPFLDSSASRPVDASDSVITDELALPPDPAPTSPSDRHTQPVLIPPAAPEPSTSWPDEASKTSPDDLGFDVEGEHTQS